MFKKFSLKQKSIIFIVAAIIGLGIIVHEGINNNKKSLVENKKSEQTIKKDIKEDVNKSVKIEIDKKVDKNESLYNEAYRLFFDKNYQKSINICDKIIKENKNYYKAYNIKGISLCFAGNFQDGMENIDKCLQINPNFGYGRFNKALAYELYGKYDKALVWYNKALEVEDYTWSYYGIASIYGRYGDADNAVKYLDKAIKKSPSVKEEAKKEKDFDNVRNSKKFKALVQ